MEEVVPKKKDAKDKKDDNESEKEKDEEKQPEPKRRIVRKVREDPISYEDITLPAFKTGGQCYNMDSLSRWLSTPRDQKYENRNPITKEPFTLEERAQVFELARIPDPSGGDNDLLYEGDFFPGLVVVPRAGNVLPVEELPFLQFMNEGVVADNVDLVNDMIQNNQINPSIHFNYAISIASALGRLPIVERLLQDDRVDPTEHDNFAIRFADRGGHYDVVNRLLRVDSVRQGVLRDGDLRRSIEEHLGREIEP